MSLIPVPRLSPHFIGSIGRSRFISCPPARLIISFASTSRTYFSWRSHQRGRLKVTLHHEMGNVKRYHSSSHCSNLLLLHTDQFARQGSSGVYLVKDERGERFNPVIAAYGSRVAKERRASASVNCVTYSPNTLRRFTAKHCPTLTMAELPTYWKRHLMSGLKARSEMRLP